MTVTITEAMTMLLDELIEGEVPLPLAQRFTLANLWTDLARIAAEDVPAEVLAVIESSLDQPVSLPAPVARGSYADHRYQFPELYAD